MENTHARTLFRKAVNTSATIDVKLVEIVVSIGRRANNPLLIAKGFADQRRPVSWLGDWHLRIRFF
ncbi:MAG: hypothetical protein OXN84_06820 [Albidovulum sp.]|nr:hypothetical protein [Albidovulum sp.]